MQTVGNVLQGQEQGESKKVSQSPKGPVGAPRTLRENMMLEQDPGPIKVNLCGKTSWRGLFKKGLLQNSDELFWALS